MRHAFRNFSLAVLLAGTSGVASAATVWDESLHGDLSSTGLAPSPLTLGVGSNTVRGTTGNSGSGIDRDYFTFAIASGFTLGAVTLLPDTNVSGGSSFFAMQAGPQVTTSPNGAGADALLGFTHYGNDLIGQDLLFAIGFLDLGAGVYSVWVQETGGPATYGFDFQVQAVPLPGAALLLLSGLAGLTTLRRRLSSS